jgi:parvulin-like peptidyl-prolyl isomerase
MQTRMAAALVLLALVAAGCTQKKVVGRVLGRDITEEEFLSRYQEYLDQSGEQDNQMVRRRILANMLNEILIREDAKRQKFDSDSLALERLEEIRTQALLDVYAKKMTTDTMSVSDAVMAEEFRATNTRVWARYVYAKDEEGALRLKHRLERGDTFEKIAREVFADSMLASTGGNLGSFGYNEMERPLQDAAFRLPVGALSDPVRLSMGWAIVRVDKHVEAPLKSEIDFAKAKPKLQDAIAERRVRAMLTEKGAALRGVLQPEFDAAGLDLALKGWSRMPGMIEESRTLDASELAHPFMKSSLGYWTVGEFMRRSALMRDKDRRRVRSVNEIRDVAVGLATRDLLVREARAKNVEQDRRTTEQADKAFDDFLFRRWRLSILDTLGANAAWNEDSLRATYERNADMFVLQPTLNVAELVVRSKGEIDGIMAKLGRGEKFDVLARRYSLNRETAEAGGEIGFAPPENFGRFAQQLFDTPVGRIVGPIDLGPMWGVFKVLGKRPGRVKTFEEARMDVIASLMPGRQQRALQAALDTLGARGHRVMDTDVVGALVVPKR